MNQEHKPTEAQHQGDRRRLSFGEAIDRAVVYLMAGLIGWLCLNSLEQGKQITTLVERGASDRKIIDELRREQQDFRRSDAILMEKMQEFEVEAARHGWKR